MDSNYPRAAPVVIIVKPYQGFSKQQGKQPHGDEIESLYDRLELYDRGKTVKGTTQFE